MAKEVDLYPGVVYEAASGAIYIVADQSPNHQNGNPQTGADYPWWSSYLIGYNPDEMKLRPIAQSTESPKDIVRLRQPLSRDEMVNLIDVSDFQPEAQEHFRKDIIEEIDNSFAKLPRRISAPNLVE